MEININIEEVIQDCKVFNSPATTLFFLSLVIEGEKAAGSWFHIRIAAIADRLGITNPYMHMKRIEDHGFIKKNGLGTHGTQCLILKNYGV